MEEDILVCDGKLAFDTKAEAQGALLTAEYQYGVRGRLKVYKCKHCALFHLSSV